jgi:hypothetical protein
MPTTPTHAHPSAAPGTLAVEASRWQETETDEWKKNLNSLLDPLSARRFYLGGLLRLIHKYNAESASGRQARSRGERQLARTTEGGVSIEYRDQHMAVFQSLALQHRSGDTGCLGV